MNCIYCELNCGVFYFAKKIAQPLFLTVQLMHLKTQFIAGVYEINNSRLFVCVKNNNTWKQQFSN